MPVKAIAFDAYGTLFDVTAAIMRYRDAVGPDAEAVAALWRAKQLEYSWTLTLMGRFVDFWALTERALDFALARYPAVDARLRDDLLAAYWRLDAYADVVPALARLRSSGRPLVIFTNGTEAMVRAAAEATGIATFVGAIVSVERIGAYKTAAAAYAELVGRLGLAASDVALVSANRWDVAGAKNAGLVAIWCNRAGHPDEYSELAPDAVVASLADLAVI